MLNSYKSLSYILAKLLAEFIKNFCSGKTILFRYLKLIGFIIGVFGRW